MQSAKKISSFLLSIYCLVPAQLNLPSPNVIVSSLIGHAFEAASSWSWYFSFYKKDPRPCLAETFCKMKDAGFCLTKKGSVCNEFVLQRVLRREL